MRSEIISINQAKVRGIRRCSYNGSSTSIESEGARRGYDFLKKYQNITFYVHDRNNRTSKIMREETNLNEYRDPNHIKMGFGKNIFLM